MILYIIVLLIQSLNAGGVSLQEYKKKTDLKHDGKVVNEQNCGIILRAIA